MRQNAVTFRFQFGQDCTDFSPLCVIREICGQNLIYKSKEEVSMEIYFWQAELLFSKVSGLLIYGCQTSQVG